MSLTSERRQTPESTHAPTEVYLVNFFLTGLERSKLLLKNNKKETATVVSLDTSPISWLSQYFQITCVRLRWAVSALKLQEKKKNRSACSSSCVMCGPEVLRLSDSWLAQGPEATIFGQMKWRLRKEAQAGPEPRVLSWDPLISAYPAPLHTTRNRHSELSAKFLAALRLSLAPLQLPLGHTPQLICILLGIFSLPAPCGVKKEKVSCILGYVYYFNPILHLGLSFIILLSLYI